MANTNDPNRTRHRTTGGDWWEDAGYNREDDRQRDNIGSYNNYGIDNDHDYRFRERHRDTDMPPYGHIPGDHPFNTAFGTYMGNYGQIVYDPSYGIDSFGYHNTANGPNNINEPANFRGRGPRNYVRSEARVREDICDLLTDDPAVDASDIEVTIDNDVVILSGTVPNRYTKRKAADIVEDIPGVRNVENRIRVRSDEANADYKYPTATTSGGATNLNSRAEKKHE